MLLIIFFVYYYSECLVLFNFLLNQLKLIFQIFRHFSDFVQLSQLLSVNVNLYHLRQLHGLSYQHQLVKKPHTSFQVNLHLVMQVLEFVQFQFYLKVYLIMLFNLTNQDIFLHIFKSQIRLLQAIWELIHTNLIQQIK